VPDATDTKPKQGNPTPKWQVFGTLACACGFCAALWYIVSCIVEAGFGLVVICLPLAFCALMYIVAVLNLLELINGVPLTRLPQVWFTLPVSARLLNEVVMLCATCPPILSIYYLVSFTTAPIARSAG
jgi:hypothetical protein